MNTANTQDNESEMRKSRQLVDVFIQVGLIIILVMLCYAIFKPFLSLMLWAIILAVTIYPLHRKIANRLGGKQGRAAILLLLFSTVLIVVPSALLMGSFGDSTGHLVQDLKNNTLQIPAPSANVAEWPIVGKKLHTVWSQAHANLPALLQTRQAEIASLSKHALSMVAGIAVSALMFFFSWIIAGIIMAFGESGARATRAIFNRLFGSERGAEFTALTTATIRAVAQGVIGVALIQAIVVGVVMLIAGIPFTGILALLVLLLGIAQIPALLITLPVIAYLWISGDYGTVSAIVYTILLAVAGMLDNVLKPLMLGRGVNAPMPVILLGALGGMASNGIMGMFLGAVLLALGYQIFWQWVNNNPNMPHQEALSKQTTED